MPIQALFHFKPLGAILSFLFLDTFSCQFPLLHVIVTKATNNKTYICVSYFVVKEVAM